MKRTNNQERNRRVSDEKTLWAKNHFREALRNPQVWRDKGRDLLDTCSYLKPRIEAAWQAHRQHHVPAGKRFDDVYGTYFMLVAFALENLCKAVIVKRRQHEFSPGDSVLPAFLRTHRLPELLAGIGLGVDRWYTGVLERLTRASTWAGRYPVPSTASGLLRGHQLGMMLEFYTADDLGDLQRLVDAVERIVTRELGPS